MILVKTKSTMPRKNAITTTSNKTAELVLMVSCLSGHTTFFSSIFDCSKKIRSSSNFCAIPCFGNSTSAFFFIALIARKVMAGQEGFEPPALGFGVRCSTVRATGLRMGNYRYDSPTRRPTVHYFDSRCLVCLPQKGQNLLNSIFAVVFFLFFSVA